MRLLVVRRILVLLLLCLGALPAGAATLVGNVFEDLTGNGQWDSGEPGIPCVVELRRQSDGQLIASRRSSGGLLEGCGYAYVTSFFFDYLPAGNYSVIVTGISPSDFEAPAPWLVTIGLGDTTYESDYHDFALHRKSGSPGILHVISGCVEGGCGDNNAAVDCPRTDELVQLQDDTGSVIQTTTTDGFAAYHFDRVKPGVYRVVALTRTRETSAGASADAHGKKLDNSTIQVTVVPEAPLYRADFAKFYNFSRFLKSPILSEGDAVPGGVSLDDATPINGYANVIRRVTKDGSLIVLDPAGTELRRLGSSGNLAVNEPLLSPATRDDENVLVRRIYRVETSANGMSAVLAERADLRRVIYRLDGAHPPAYVDSIIEAPTSVELAVSDDGQIAYTGRTSGDQPALLLARPGTDPPRVLRRLGVDAVGSIPIARVSDLTGNDQGDLAWLAYGQGTSPLAVMRWREGKVEVVATAGDRVAKSRTLGSSAGSLTGFLKPRIGPDGTVTFVGLGTDFVNFFAIPAQHGPVFGAAPRPLLDGAGWNPHFQYAMAANGAVVVTGDTGDLSVSSLTYVTPAGAAREVLSGTGIYPLGALALTSDGRLFFLGWTQAAGHSIYRYDSEPPGLLSVVAGKGRVIPGQQTAPGRPVAQMADVPNLPVVSGDYVAFAGVFSGGRFPEPTAGLFRVPVRGALEDGLLLASEGNGLTNTSRVVSIQDFYYTADGSLIVHALAQRWLLGGQLIYTVPPAAGSSAGPTVQQTTPTLVLTELLKTSNELPQGSGRIFVKVLNQLVSVGPSPGRWVFAAQFSQKGQKGQKGEGLFFLDSTQKDPQKRVQELAGTDSSVPGLDPLSFAGFGDADLNTPSTGDDNVVFKAHLKRGAGDLFGLFQWTGRDLIRVSPVTPDRSGLDRWVAGPSGRAYFLARDRTNPKAPTVQLCEFSGGNCQTLVLSNQTKIQLEDNRTATLQDISDVKLNGDGQLFFEGTARREDGSQFRGVFNVEGVGTGATTRVKPLVLQEQTIPPLLGQAPPPKDNSTAPPVPVFDSNFVLRPESACRNLYFAAYVRKQGDNAPSSLGYFTCDAHRNLTTLFLAEQTVSSKNTGGSGKLPPNQPCDPNQHSLSTSQARPSEGQVLAYASRDPLGFWAIYRKRLVTDPNQQTTMDTTDQVVREFEGGRLLPDLHRAYDDPDALPSFVISTTGEVAYLAAEDIDGSGLKQVLYRYADAGEVTPTR
jgi:hypothetical protein